MPKEPKEYFVDKVEDIISEIEEQLDELETKLEDSGWEPEMDLENQIDSFRVRLEEVRKEVESYEVTSGSAWRIFKRSSQNMLSEISREVQELAARMDQVLLE
jgi:ElaB/YqjD/DUF883 family membrane-anchored ribosome-binding protein